jgi:DNA repair protein RadA/Sms
LQNQDIYINVAGGFELDERAADLPVVLAVLSSLYSKPLPATLVAFAEVGLAGEVRMVTQLDKRIKEAAKLGFNEIWTAKQKDKTVRAGVNGLGSITELSKIFKD